MSEINANIVVQPFDINITLDQPGITVTPNVTSLNIYAVGGTNGVPAGNIGDLQYNAANGFAAIPSNVANYTLGNLKLNVGNLNITGGNNGYFLQTDGTGNIDWAAGGGGGGNGSPGGSNTQIQYNDSGSFGGSAGFTFNKTSNLVSMPGNLIVAGNISGTNANFSGNINAVTVTANLNGSATTAGTVTSNAQPNITSVGTLTTLGVSGTITAANITANTGVFTGNATGLTNIPGANVTGTVANATFALNAGNANIANVAYSVSGANVTGQVGNALVAGTVYTNAQPNITSVGTLTNLSVTGNITAANIIGNIAGPLANGTSSVSIPTANGNVNTSVGTQPNVFVVTIAGANIGGTLNTSGDVTVANLTSNNRITSSNANVTNTLTVNTQANIANLTITSGFGIALGNGAIAVANGASFGYRANAGVANSVAIGYTAQADGRGTSVGYAAGTLGGAGGTRLDQTFIGAQSGQIGNAAAYGSQTAVGAWAGHRADGDNTVAIGTRAGEGNYSNGASSIGQATNAIAIGYGAGRTNQQIGAVALGFESGSNNQGTYSIAIGARAGDSQANNSITIDASNSFLSANIANSFFVKPIRNVLNANIVMYNATSGEVTYNTLTNYTGYVSTISTTVNALVAANSVNSGTRAYVTDGNTTTFYSVIGSGGSNGVPVFSDGTDWRVG